MALQHKESDILDDLEGFDDFTIASSWERFIARTEAVCREWQSASVSELLASGTTVEGVPKLHKVHRELAYGTKSYGIDFYFEAVTEHGSSREEWTDGLHPLQLWFGVTDFVIIFPMSMSGVVLDAPEATLLLSTMAVALSNCGSDWPAFVPVHDPTRKAYHGIKGTKSFGARYETDRIGRVPVKLLHLDGLYDLFTSKMAYKTAGVPTPPKFKVEFTMQLTYRTPMPGFEYLDATAEPISNYDGDMLEDLAWDEDCAWAEWHSVEDPVKGFELICTLSKRSLMSAMDAAEYQKISPTEAEKWSLTIVKVKDQAAMQESTGFVGRLRALVRAFQVASQAQFVEDFAADVPSTKHVTHHLTVPPPTVLNRVLKDIFQEGKDGILSISFSITVLFLQLLDARHVPRGMPVLAPHNPFEATLQRGAPFDNEVGHADHEYAHGVKGAPPDSLFSRFCLHGLQFGTCNIRAIAVLWIGFVREVRWCWDEGLPLPRVFVDGSPDLKSCLLHQKLQLLALCIEQIASQQAVVEDLQQDDYPQGSPTDDSRMLTSIGGCDERRKGSAGPVGKLMLLNSRLSLHAPITQKRPILTEDMLEERKQTLATLQNASWGNVTRPCHQRDILASDMAAFKAANPGAVLEDFMHWYLLRKQPDLEDVQEGDFAECGDPYQAAGIGFGSVLNTMSRSDSVEIWESVNACAACDQKPLFDYTREAEKVLHYLDTIRPQQLLAQMLASSFAVAADTLNRSVIDFGVPTLMWELEELSASMESVFPSSEGFIKTEKRMSDQARELHSMFLKLCAVFERVEGNIILAVSLGKKLSKAPRLLAALINHHLEPHKVPVARVLVEKGLTSNRWKEVESLDEREVVARLFAPLTPSESWKSSPSMGHFLNGHEPHAREVILWCPSEPPGLLQNLDIAPTGNNWEAEELSEHVYSHRMYVQGTVNEMQVAYVAVSMD